MQRIKLYQPHWVYSESARLYYEYSGGSWYSERIPVVDIDDKVLSWTEQWISIDTNDEE